jgi:uncharacterized membrane protein
MLVLRIIHVCAGIFWGGGALMMHSFFGPTVRATEQVGQKFAGHMMLKTKFVNVMTIMASLTVLAGASLYWIDTGGFTSAWTQSAPGIGFAIGGFFGLVGFIFGAMFGRLNKQLATLGSRVQGQPTPEQLAEIQAVQKKIAFAERFHVPAVILAILFMSASRYLIF